MNILESIATSGPGRLLTKQLGLKDPPTLRRGNIAPAGDIVLTATGNASLGAQTLQFLGIQSREPLEDSAATRISDEGGKPRVVEYESAPGAVLVDASDLSQLDELEHIRAVLRPAIRGLEKSGRVIFLGPEPAASADHEARAAAEALDGLMRTIGKELRGGATANLVRVAADTRAEDLASTVDFLLSGRSAFVSGQTWSVTTGGTPDNSSLPLAGRIVVVTGAARGIGAAIAQTCSEHGATVVAVDLPAAGESLAQVAVQTGGSALQVDITDPSAAEAITTHIRTVHGHDANLWAIVHNAGITRDKLLANLDEHKWRQVIDINLRAEMDINDALLNKDLPGSFAGEGRIIGIASTSGIAGNKGQSNYAASKAGVIGYTHSLAAELATTEITANAVAPGFIETDMTAQIPYLNREIFRRVNSLSQGGRPVDVAQTIAYLVSPSSGAVNGQVIRVCGQNIVGK